MMYDGKRLEDFRCLKYYNIKAASQIYYVNGQLDFIFVQDGQGPSVDIVYGLLRNGNLYV